MNKKSLFLLLILSTFFQFCSRKKAADYTGNFIGDIRGNKLSMLLKNDDKSMISGTIFDRNIHFKVAGEVIDGKFSGTAIDTVKKLEFIVNADWEKDTMMWNMQMIKPQESQIIVIKFIKVFINKEEKNPVAKSSGDTTMTPSATTENSKKDVQIKEPNSIDIYDPTFYGLWQVMRSDKMDGSKVFNDNKYVYFNVNGSMSYLDKILVPLEGYKWFTVNDTLFVNSKVDGKVANDILGKYKLDSDKLTIEKNNKSIDLKKMK